MEFTAAKQQQMMEHFLEKGEDRLYVQVFDFTDRIGHMLWRLYDPGHPLYDARLAAEYGQEIPRSYERMDRIVGEAQPCVHYLRAEAAMVRGIRRVEGAGRQRTHHDIIDDLRDRLRSQRVW